MIFCIRLNVNDDGIVTTVQGIYKGNNPNFARILESDEKPFNEIAAGPKYIPDVSRYTSFKRIYINDIILHTDSLINPTNVFAKINIL